jgi:hypothetical protein
MPIRAIRCTANSRHSSPVNTHRLVCGPLIVVSLLGGSVVILKVLFWVYRIVITLLRRRMAGTTVRFTTVPDRNAHPVEWRNPIELLLGRKHDVFLTRHLTVLVLVEVLVALIEVGAGLALQVLCFIEWS